MNSNDVDTLEQNNMISDEDELAYIAVNVYTPYSIDGKMLYKPTRLSKCVNNAFHNVAYY